MIHKKDSAIFIGIPNAINIGHYHSWVVSDDGFPEDSMLKTSVSEEGWIMSLEHKEQPVYGIQFHPESIMTEYGMDMLKNWLEAVK